MTITESAFDLSLLGMYLSRQCAIVIVFRPSRSLDPRPAFTSTSCPSDDGVTPGRANGVTTGNPRLGGEHLDRMCRPPWAGSVGDIPFPVSNAVSAVVAEVCQNNVVNVPTRALLNVYVWFELRLCMALLPDLT